MKQPVFIYHRWLFELEHPDNIWHFVKDELDNAENHPDGFIGSKLGIDCYLIQRIEGPGCKDETVCLVGGDCDPDCDQYPSQKDSNATKS